MIDVGPVVEKGCHSGGLERRPIAVIPLFSGGLSVRFFKGTQEPLVTKACESHWCTPPERVSAQETEQELHAEMWSDTGSGSASKPAQEDLLAPTPGSKLSGLENHTGHRPVGNSLCLRKRIRLSLCGSLGTFSCYAPTYT